VSKRAVALFVAIGLVWGIPYMLIRVAVEHLEPATLVFARTAIGACVLLPVAAARGELRPLLPRWKPILAYTVVELAVPWLLLSSAEQRLPSSLAGLLVAAVPLVGAVMAFAGGDRRHLAGRSLVGLLVGLGGVAVLVGLDIPSPDVGAVAMVGGVVLGYAGGPALVARYLSDAPALGVVATSLSLCAAGYAPFVASSLPHAVASAPPRVLASVLTLGLVCTALAFVLFFALISEAGPVRATVVTYINPAVAVLLGCLVLAEPFTAATAGGFVLVLAGSYLATRGGRHDVGLEAPALGAEAP
jgi:drug/metabolite transporter (DMT)-like permease